MIHIKLLSHALLYFSPTWCCERPGILAILLLSSHELSAPAGYSQKQVYTWRPRAVLIQWEAEKTQHIHICWKTRLPTLFGLLAQMTWTSGLWTFATLASQICLILRAFQADLQFLLKGLVLGQGLPAAGHDQEGYQHSWISIYWCYSFRFGFFFWCFLCLTTDAL